MVDANWDIEPQEPQEPQEIQDTVKAINYLTTAIEGIEKHFDEQVFRPYQLRKKNLNQFKGTVSARLVALYKEVSDLNEFFSDFESK